MQNYSSHLAGEAWLWVDYLALMKKMAEIGKIVNWQGGSDDLNEIY